MQNDISVSSVTTTASIYFNLIQGLRFSHRHSMFLNLCWGSIGHFRFAPAALDYQSKLDGETIQPSKKADCDI